jgi:uncharacterized membrane protein
MLVFPSTYFPTTPNIHLDTQQIIKNMKIIIWKIVSVVGIVVSLFTTRHDQSIGSGPIVKGVQALHVVSPWHSPHRCITHLRRPPLLPQYQPQRCQSRYPPSTTISITPFSNSVRTTKPSSSSTTSTTSTTAQRMTILSSLHSDPSYCLTAVLLVSTFGIALEQRTMIGKALSAPLVTMAVALILANIGLLPFTSPIYTIMNQYAVSLAVPMLLYDSNLRRVISDTGSVLVAFLIGAVATVVGTLIAFPLLPMKSLGIHQGYKVACALCARHIGGAINFVAVAETLQIPGTIVSAAIAADNVVVALYFAVLFALAKADPFAATAITTSKENMNESPPPSISVTTIESELDYSIDAISTGDDNTTTLLVVEPNRNEITLPTISLSLAVASSLVTIGKMATKLLLPPGTSALPLTSTITVLAATLFPKFFAKIRTAGTAIGILFIQMFFAASGASGSIALVFQQAPSLFVFSILQILIHFVVLLTVGRGIFKLPLNELYLASNANVGGPTTAAAMAQAKNWTRLVLPALLVGILGYATATGIALALGPILVRLPLLPVHR